MAKTNFLEILQKIVGKGSENRLIGEYEDTESPTGKRYIDNTKGLIESFEYADSDRQREVGKMMQTGGYDKFLGMKLPTWPGSNTADEGSGMGRNQADYVPFAYTTTSDPNELVKYGYIIRYADDPVEWGGYGPSKIYGVTTEMRNYTAEGAKNFFDKIKNNGGLVRLYTKPLDSSDIDKNTKSLQRLSDVDQPQFEGEFYGGKTREGGSGAYGIYGLIEALREANRLNRGK